MMNQMQELLVLTNADLDAIAGGLDVNGQGGSDVIIGSTGLVGLIAQTDNHRLIGGRGNDILLGQDGSDF